MSLQIIGAGLGRTGTASIKVALEQLGVGRCYHMGEVMTRPGDIELWMNAADGSPDWKRLLDEYGAAVDYPACTFWRELSVAYPDAKVLLSVRDANSWFESTQATIFSKQLRDWLINSPVHDFMKKTVWRDFGDQIDNREFMVSYFEQHIEEIKNALPEERLLVYQVKDGWEPLCKFLQVQIPDEPFPHVNSRDEMAQMIEGWINRSKDESMDTVLQEDSQGLFKNKGRR
jgi:hypothetical protein